MPDIPWIRPIGLGWIDRRLAMTSSAELIHLSARHPGRIANRAIGSCRVIGTRAVTRLTLHSRLSRLNTQRIAEPQRTGRMALEALQDGRARVERAIALA